MKLSGYTMVRNGIDLDYCFVQCLESLLAVCDEVVACDSDSTDGTPELIQKTFGDKVRIINRPWPDPKANVHWWVEWINWTRERLSHSMQLTLDADEVLDTSDYAKTKIENAVRTGASLFFRRLNFYGGSRLVAPEGHVVGTYVARLGPTRFWMPSDEPYQDGQEPEIKRVAVRDPALLIYHYGFLRKQDAFYRKSRVVQRAFWDSYDARLEKAEADKVENWAKTIPPAVPLELFEGAHPKIMEDWLIERGWMP